MSTNAKCGINGATCATCNNPMTCQSGLCMNGAGGGGGGGGGAVGGGGGTAGGGGAAGGGGGGAVNLCSPACAAGKCCDFTSCVSTGNLCPQTGIITGGFPFCKANGMCQ
jgi:hypothetical protein